MILLPFEDVTYRTKLSEAEVIRRLMNAIEPKKAFRFDLFWSSSAKPYEGEVAGNQFTISRIIRYRNSFIPQISGTIQSTIQETIVRIKMRLHPLVLVFLCGWVGFIGMFLAGSLTSLFDTENQFAPITLLPFGMIVFAYAMTMIGFKTESSRSKKDLLKLFDGEIITGTDTYIR